MDNHMLLYTLPQWFVFAAIIASVYGWVEHKKVFRLLGPAIFFLLGIFAALILWGFLFPAFDFLTPEEIASYEMEDELNPEVPFQAMLFPAFISFVASGILAIPAIILEWLNRKGKNLLVILTALIALLGFFMIVGALRSL